MLGEQSENHFNPRAISLALVSLFYNVCNASHGGYAISKLVACSCE